MEIRFWKMHGASNDFVLVDDRSGEFPVDDGAWIARICRRRRGIGAEGLILIQAAQEAGADFRMRFFNPDGGEAEMCGNGARCVARLAHDLGVAGRKMVFETAAGRVKAEVGKDGVMVGLPDPRDWRRNMVLEAAGVRMACDFVNTGVPHVVVPVEGDLAEVNVAELGAAIRYHEQFAPEGTNADFIARGEGGAVRIRTYERGVEGETPACGTGMVAAALTAAGLGWARPPVVVLPASGDRLEVDFELLEDGRPRGVKLYGPAEYVYRGEVTYSGRRV